MHAAVFASQAYISFISTSSTSHTDSLATRRAITHHSEALRLLRERLSGICKKEDKVSESTILVVLFLAIHAHLVNDYETAKNHMDGLRKMIDMRGGLFSFSHNTKLILELLK